MKTIASIDIIAGVIICIVSLIIAVKALIQYRTRQRKWKEMIQQLDEMENAPDILKRHWFGQEEEVPDSVNELYASNAMFMEEELEPEFEE